MLKAKTIFMQDNAPSVCKADNCPSCQKKKKIRYQSNGMSPAPPDINPVILRFITKDVYKNSKQYSRKETKIGLCQSLKL